MPEHRPEKQSAFQSMDYQREVLKNPSQLSRLSTAQRRSFYRGLRDLYFQAQETGPKSDESELLRQLISISGEPPNLEKEGLSLSFCPSKRFQSLRFMPKTELPQDWRADFHSPSQAAPDFAAVFVDTEEFQFRNFENIIPLDRLFQNNHEETTLHISNLSPLSQGTSLLRGRCNCDTVLEDLLLSLDQLELYTAPLNQSSRGGQRLIFHSATLAEKLSQALKEALPKEMLQGFSHVNPVFRCNRFEAGEKEFLSHYDTPYYDGARRHISRTTVLLYLTGGRGKEVLAFNEVTLEHIDPMTIILFDQSQEHKAAPYEDGRKVFLRTELIYEAGELEHNAEIAQLFSTACYLSGESPFHSELSARAHKAYDKVALAHWTGTLSYNPNETLLEKQFRGVGFLSNGYDYWFPKASLPLREIAALTLLDYFNCKIDGVAFRKLASSTVHSDKDLPWIFEKLSEHRAAQPDQLFFSIDKDKLFPKPLPVNRRSCCPGHGDPARFDPFTSQDVQELYLRAQSFSRERIQKSAILFLGQEILLDPDKILVGSDKIHFVSDQQFEPVNFAACWQCRMEPPDYIDVDLNFDGFQLLLPPILYRVVEDCYHLMFDFFRNSWMVQKKEQSIPIPKITNEAWNNENATLWMDAVDPASVNRNKRSKRDRLPFWAYPQTPLIHELYDESTE